MLLKKLRIPRNLHRNSFRALRLLLFFTIAFLFLFIIVLFIGKLKHLGVEVIKVLEDLDIPVFFIMRGPLSALSVENVIAMSPNDPQELTLIKDGSGLIYLSAVVFV